MKATVLLAVASLALSGCWSKGTGHYTVYVDASMTPERSGMVWDALHDWENLTDHTVTFTPTGTFEQTESDKITILSASIQDLTVNNGDADGISLLGGLTTYHGTSSAVELAWNVTDLQFQHTARHELGHALGLGHDEAGTLMFHSLEGASQGIACEDLDQFCGVWGCQVVANPPYCQVKRP